MNSPVPDCYTPSEEFSPLRGVKNGSHDKTTYSRVPKRQRSPEEAHENRKKRRQDSAADSLEDCPLLAILREYGLLENIISCLCPSDLLALLLCSKSMHHTIVPQPGSLENLLGKLRCPGRGVKIRRQRHKKSAFFYAYECTEYVECGAIDGGTESRPCASCKITTCDECRIHCVYQSIFERPCDDDELPNFSGFILLSPSEVPILSPYHLADDLALPHWQGPSSGGTAPYHDQGFIDVPFEEESFGPPECVEDFLDLNLGKHTFVGPVASNVAQPSPVLRSLHHITERRKRWFCEYHVPSSILKQREESSVSDCRCSLRSRFLDRWLCLRCYEDEEKTLSQAYTGNTTQYCCGSVRGHEVCLWCGGEISELAIGGEPEADPNPTQLPEGAHHEP